MTLTKRWYPIEVSFKQPFIKLMDSFIQVIEGEFYLSNLIQVPHFTHVSIDICYIIIPLKF